MFNSLRFNLLCLFILVAILTPIMGFNGTSPVVFQATCTDIVQRPNAPLDHTEPFSFIYDDGWGSLSLSSPTEGMCEALRIQAVHACSIEAVEFYVFGAGTLEVHVWDVDSNRVPKMVDLIPHFYYEVDSTSYGGWVEITLPQKVYLPPFGECTIGRKIIEPGRPIMYLSRMEDVENRSYLYIPSSRQWLQPNYADSTGSWYVTYLIRAHGTYYNVPDQCFFRQDTSFFTGTNRGVALMDCNNDGYPDLATGSQIFRNDVGSFRIVAGTGISGIGRPFWGDFDSDGRPDIFFGAAPGADKVYANAGTGFNFHDVTEPSGGMSNPYVTEGAVWFDFNKDGWMDLYLANSGTYSSVDSTWTFYPDMLYRNDGAFFRNITTSSGIGPAITVPYFGAGIALGDWNNDGWTDIYVANAQNAPNYLWQNNGDGTFMEVAFFYGVGGINLGDGQYGHTMGACFGDIDNDGNLDLFVANESPSLGYHSADRSQLYINEGPPYYFMVDQLRMRGIENHPALSVPSFIDYNNDGWLDLFATSMSPGTYAILYRNNGDGTFTNVTERSGLILNGASSHAWADINMNGYLDLVVEVGDQKLVYENRTPDITGVNNNWARFRLEGADGNKFGIGSRIYLYAGGIQQMREIGAQYGGYRSQTEPIAHFGIGAETMIDSVVIRWNSGNIERVYGVLPNFNYHWVEGTHHISETNPALPAELSVSTYPNPFNSAVKIAVETGGDMIESVEIIDLSGRRILVLDNNEVAEAESAGRSEFIWQPAPRLGSGVYFIKVKTEDKTVNHKVLYVK